MIHADIKSWLESDDAMPTILIEVDVYNGSTEETLYLSTNGYVTGGGDTPSNTIYHPYVMNAGGFSEGVSIGGDVSISVGDIEINNYEHNLDYMLDYVWKNRAINVYIGDVSWNRASFRNIFSGLVDNIQQSDSGKVFTIILRDNLDSLNVSLSEYKDADGEMLPLVFGEVFNITPKVFDEANLIYQVHNSAIAGIIEVRDSGAPVDGVVDDLANGKFTLTRNPYGQITCSVHGHLQGGQYYDDIGNTIKTLITSFGTKNVNTPSAVIDNTNFSTFITNNQQCIGLFLDGRENLLSVVNDLAANVLASVYCSKNGKIRIFQLKDPSTQPSVFSFNTWNIIEESFEIAERLPVVANINFKYNTNYTVQSNVVSGIPVKHAEIFAETGKENAGNSDSNVLSLYRLPTDSERVETHFQVKSEADAEAARRIALLSTQRYIYRFEAYREAMLLEVGDVVDIAFDRYDLNNTKGFVMSLDTDLKDGKTVVEVFV